MQGKEEAAGKKRKQAAMDSCTLPHKINKWHLLPFIINHLNGNKWIFITIYYLGQLVDANRFCADLSTSLQQSGWQIPERNLLTANCSLLHRHRRISCRQTQPNSRDVEHDCPKEGAI